MSVFFRLLKALSTIQAFCLQSKVEVIKKMIWRKTDLHFCRLVVAAVLVFICSAVAITDETLKAVFSPQLANNLVQCLTVEGVIVHCKGRVADGRQ